MTILATIAAAILAASMNQISPQSSSVVNGSVGLVTLNKRDVGGKYHAAIAVSGFGDVVGQMLNKRGDAVCNFGGVYDARTGCVTLVGCVSGTECL